MSARTMAADWQPSASIEMLRQRAALLDAVREYFRDRGVLEVETPLLSRHAITDPALHSATARLAGLTQEFFLHTSPEFFMKRLLAAGSSDIWQVCKVFRGAEQGRWHNPEFTLLEWYRLDFDHYALMDEVADLLQLLLPARVNAAAQILSYRDVFISHADIDPFVATDAELREAVSKYGIAADDYSRDDCLDLLASHAVYPHLGHDKVTFVTDFPASQAALARLNADGETARRFEAFVDGVELANGFHELGNADEQRVRFEAENVRRCGQGLPQMPIDRHLLEALEHDFPDCAGVAVGFDRIVMLASGADSITDVLSFDFDRA